jgi:hypothetical protein
MAKEKRDLFIYYDVRWNFENRLMAGVPADPNIIDRWLKARQASDSKFKNMQSPKVMETLVEEVKGEIPENAIPEGAIASYLIFKRTPEQELYLESYQPKAHLKDAARVLGSGIYKKEISFLKSKFADRVFIEPEHIMIRNQKTGFILKGQPPIAGDWFEHPVHVFIPGVGERSALKSNEFIENGSISFMMKVLDDKVITRNILEELMDYGSIHGFMAERGLGYGRYSYEINEVGTAKDLADSETEQAV